MEVQSRTLQVGRKVNVLDQENAYVSKNGVSIPRKMGLNVRGVLGELNTNTNLKLQPSNNVVKGTISCEIENKTRRSVRSYKHVQSKIDTGLSGKPVVEPSARPPLRREESTARLAVRAVASRTALKDVQNKPAEIKEKVNVLVQAKKVTLVKKRLPALKESSKEVKSVLNPATESLGKLKLGDDVSTKPEVAKELNSTPELPDNIEDIDAKDNTEFFMPHYIKDIYRYLTTLEDKYAICRDHLAYQVAVTGRMRATLIDWLVEVQNQFRLELETFHMTVGIIDRYLQVTTNVQRGQLQLVGVTAMFIASKYEEVFAPVIHDFVFITDNAYTVADVLQCEVEILSKLGYCLARPVPISFLRRFVKAARGTCKNHHLAKYFVDLCLVEYSMAHYKPSELAAAALCLSLHLLSAEKSSLTEVWTPTLQYYSEYTLKHLLPIITKMAKLVVGVHKSVHQSVYKKYSEKKLGFVSTLPELKSDAMLRIAEEA